MRVQPGHDRLPIAELRGWEERAPRLAGLARRGRSWFVTEGASQRSNCAVQSHFRCVCRDLQQFCDFSVRISFDFAKHEDEAKRFGESIDRALDSNRVG